jgi:hypothetical protein
MKQFPPFPFSKGGYRHSGRDVLPEHRQMSGPGIIDDIAPVIQRIAGNIGQCVPQVEWIVQPERLYLDSSQNPFLAILMTEIHRIHLLAVFAESLGIFPFRCQGGRVRMVRHNGIGDDNHLVPPGANGKHLHHHVIILIIPAQHRRFQSLQANVVRLYAFRIPIWELSDNTSFHHTDHSSKKSSRPKTSLSRQT